MGADHQGGGQLRGLILTIRPIGRTAGFAILPCITPDFMRCRWLLAFPIQKISGPV